MARDLFIGVDAGGTFTRSVLVDATSTVFARGSAGGANHWTTSPKGARETVRAAIRAVLQRPRGPPIETVTGVGIGWSGLETTASAEDARRFVGDAVHAAHHVLDSDVRADFARTVDRLASRGDAPSRGILERAGRYLAELALAVADRLDGPQPVPLSCTGGVWDHSTTVRATFAEAIGAAGVPFGIVRAGAPAETGAALMAIAATGRTLPDVIASGTPAGP